MFFSIALPRPAISTESIVSARQTKVHTLIVEDRKLPPLRNIASLRCFPSW